MDRKLFPAILEVHEISINTKAVAEKLNTDDQPCMAKAVSRRLQNIKAQIKAGAGAGAVYVLLLMFKKYHC